MLMVWLKFIVCALVIFLAGARLAKCGDVIAEKTGLCRAWIGLVLLAVVTSLPELANGISAVVGPGIPDLAVGDILGACMINMFTLAVLDFFFWLRGGRSIFIDPKSSNLLSSLFAIALLLFTAFSLVASRYLFDFQLFGVSIYTLGIFVIYLIAQKMLFAKSDGGKIEEAKKYSNISNFKTYFSFGLLAVIVIAAGSWLPFIGKEIVETMGWGSTFVAVLFLGLATTLPELTVSISALRLGYIGMSIGNLLGSNIFNIAILFIVDIFYQGGSLLADASFNMIYVALVAAVLTGIVYVAMKRQITNRIPAVTMIVLFLFSLFFLFQAGILSF